ncbi:MAG: hypothetical protein IJE84_02885 [Clostridia bacterium]|nr:hypothetical protein [Clostridia bacterium]
MTKKKILICLIAVFVLLCAVSCKDSDNISGVSTDSDSLIDTPQGSDSAEESPQSADITASSVPTELQVPDTESSPDTTTAQAPETTKKPAESLPIGSIASNGELVAAEDMMLSEQEMGRLYNLAETAVNNRNWQYAYGLFSRLAVEGYFDSDVRAAALRSRAYATPVIEVSSYVFANFSDPDAASSTGFLYADECGTPQFIYPAREGGKIVARVFTPDPSLSGVISFTTSGMYYHTVCVCVKSNGDVYVFYDPDSIAKMDAAGELEKCSKDLGVCVHCFAYGYVGKLTSFIEELQSQKNVVRCISGYDGIYFGFVFIHSDGSVDYYHKGVNYTKAVIEDIGEVEGVIDLCYPWGDGPFGATAEGRTFGSEESLEYRVFKNLTQVYARGEGFVLNDGRAYYRIEGRMSSGNTKFSYKEDAVFAMYCGGNQYLFISSDGEIYDHDDEKIGSALDLSHLYWLDPSHVFAIKDDGSVTLVSDYSDHDSEWYDVILSKLKTVKIY